MDKALLGTHQYSKRFTIIKYVSISFLSIILLVIFFLVVVPMLKDLEWNLQIAVEVGAILVIVTISAFAHYLFINKVYDNFSTMAYMRKVLETKVSFFEASFLKQIFEPEYTDSDSWESMHGLVHLPENLRRKTAMEVAKKLLSNKPAKPQAKPVEKPQDKKVPNQKTKPPTAPASKPAPPKKK